MGKKNLDKLFQENLRDFSDIPSGNVWSSIETSLNEKKKSRKIIPFWWRLGGIAAALVFALYVFSPFENNILEKQPIISDIEHTEQPAAKKAENTFEKPANNNGQIVDVGQEPVNNHQNVSGNTISNAPEIEVRTKSASTTIVSQGNTTKNTRSKEVETIKSENNNPLIANKSTNSTDRPVITVNNLTNITLADNIVKEKRVEETNIKNNENTTALNIAKNEVIGKTTKTEAAQIERESVVKTTETIKKKSIFDEIASQEEEKEMIAENDGAKWSAGPSIAPVYFNTIGQGSPVSSIFVPNSKSGDVNLSFGLSVAYKVSRKLSIRSGLHKVDYGYRTNDVEFSSSLGNSANGQLPNVDYTLASENLIVKSNVENTTNVEFDQNYFQEAKTDVSAVSASREGFMAQEFGYLEIPLELDYALVDNKFGINLIGGVSSLFLVDNSISLTSGELTTEMGKANNLNSINFSTNIGFGINYKFTPKVQFNVEPIFKYQLSTFSSTNGSFRPFSIGVYSGLSFKF